MDRSPSPVLGRPLALARTTAFAGYSAGALLSYELHHRAVPPEDVAPLRARYKRRVAGDILRLLGVQWAVDGPPPEPDRPRLVVANHRTALDIGLLLTHFAGSMLSRADVARWPVLGRLATHGETIFVDRTDKNSGARAIRQIRRALLAGRTVVAFPEGTTFAGDEVRPFQGGAFAAVRGLSVDIVPVGLAYEPGVEWVGGGFLDHMARIAGRHGTSVVAKIGAAFPSTGSARELAARAEADVSALVVEARHEFDRRFGRPHAPR